MDKNYRRVCRTLICIGYALTFLLPMYTFGTSNRLCSDQDVKRKVSQCTDGKQRTPQNVMSKVETFWFEWRENDCLLMHYYPSDSLREDQLLQKIVSTIENNSCVKLKDYKSSEHKGYGDYCDLRHLILSQESDADELTGAVFRTLLMCMGKLYEHRRTDRDEYVQVYWNNVRSSKKDMFSIRPDSFTQGLPYDFSSCMQFRYDELSKNRYPTILPRNSSIPWTLMGSSLWPSEQDYLDINLSFCGTETVITTFDLLSRGCDFIEMEWNKPKYCPISMEMKVKCKLYCDDKWYVKSTYTLLPNSTRLNLKDLKPGTTCTVTLLVLYNPSRYDRGLQRYPTTLPSRPTQAPRKIKVVHAKENELSLSWQPIPCSDQNGEILHYVVRYHHHKVAPEEVQEQESQTDGHCLGIVLSNLTANTEYNITIAGVNLADVGIFSLPIVAITLGARPGRVMVVSSHSTSSSISITWVPPLDENGLPHKVSLMYSYTHRLNRKRFRQLVSCTSWTVENLKSDEEVQFSLKAINKSGREGPTTHETRRTTYEPIRT